LDPAEERRRRAATAPAPKASTQSRKQDRERKTHARRKPENVRDTFADEETFTSKRDYHFKKNRASNMLRETITTSPERKGMHHIYEKGIGRLFMKGTR
jgi:hypothetical protein